MHPLDVVFEMIQVGEVAQMPTLWVATAKRAFHVLVFKVNFFDMIHHLRNPTERVYTCAIWEPLLANAIYALRLVEHKWKGDVERLQGIMM